MLEKAALFVIRHAPNVWIAHYLTVIHAIAQFFGLLSMVFLVNVSALLGTTRILTVIANHVTHLVRLALGDLSPNAPLAASPNSENLIQL